MDQVTLPRATVQQALEALEGGGDSWRLIGPAIDALRAALEQPAPDVPETNCGNMQVEWADIPEEFNEWWDADRLTQTNPFREDSPAYWAWEGWQARAALEQPKPPPEAQTKAEKIAYCAGWWAAMEAKAKQPAQEPVALFDARLRAWRG
jgi:hypothetical protein